MTRLKTHRLFQVDIDRREVVNNVVRPTMNKLSTMLFQVVTVEQCCNNMLTILFIVGRTTLFTPVDINLEQVVDFLNFYACILKFASYSFSLSFKFARFNFAHLVETYTRSFKFAQVNFRVRHL